MINVPAKHFRSAGSREKQSSSDIILVNSSCFQKSLLVCSCDGELARGNGGIFFPQGGVLKCFQIFWLPLCVTKLLVPNLKRNSLLILSTTVCLIHVYVLSMSSMTFWTEHKLFSLQIFKKWLGHLLWEEDLIICGI